MVARINASIELFLKKIILHPMYIINLIIFTSTKQVVFFTRVCSWLVCYQNYKNYRMDYYKTWMEDCSWPRIDPHYLLVWNWINMGCEIGCISTTLFILLEKNALI